MLHGRQLAAVSAHLGRQRGICKLSIHRLRRSPLESGLHMCVLAVAGCLRKEVLMLEAFCGDAGDLACGNAGDLTSSDAGGLAGSDANLASSDAWKL